MNYVLIASVLLIGFSVGMAVRAVKSGKKPGRALAMQVAAFAAICLVSVSFPLVANAASNGETPAEGTSSSQSAPVSDNNKGLGLLGAALAVGIAGIGGGIAVGGAAPAAIGATSEDPKAFGKAMIFVALGESIALYGFVISFMIIGKI